jgi:peptide/nickel transport system substrate-binding protein
MLNRNQLTACVVVALLTAPACTFSRAESTNHNRVLVVDKSFDLTTADPHRDLSATGAILAKALYSTLMTFDGGTLATPVPELATSYSASEDATRFTFNLRHDVVFSDGSPLTAADVVFSFERLARLKSTASPLLAGVAASAPDAFTIVLESNRPNPSLPLLLANPALAVVNAAVVKDRGEGYLSNAAAGSGPYILASFSAFSDVALVANPRYSGQRPFYGRVVIRSMNAQTQLTYIASATDQVALDLSPGQAGTLIRNQSVVIKAVAGPDVAFLFANNNPRVSSVTSNKHFQNAVRYALDYDSMVQLTGAGAVQATGVIPSTLLGALPAWAGPRHDIDKARTELAASGVKNPTVNLGFANDQTVSGLPMSALASMVRAELAAAGIAVYLTGSPSSSATADYNAGAQQMGIWSVTATSADPNPYLDFLPGRTLGLRAGWPAGADPLLESLGIQAATTADLATRTQLLQSVAGQLNEDGPFFPLVQPGRTIVATKDITTIDYNPTWSIDLAAVTG